MVSKNYLSDKKTSTQTISISPALKDWISRFTKNKHKEDPNDERYRSISAFYCDVIEKALQMFEKGKSLDDFEKITDSKISQFWDQIMIRVNIPRHESAVEANRYSGYNLNTLMRFLISMRKMYLKDEESSTLESIKRYFDRIKEYTHSPNVIDYINLEFIKGKNKMLNSGVFEMKGKVRNLHFEISKTNALIIGMIGGKIKNCIYSKKDLYTRFDIIPTDLLYDNKLRLKERKVLMNENLELFTNLSRVIEDKDKYLWMQMAEDTNLIMTFKNQTSFEKWIEKIESDIKLHRDKEEFLTYVLYYFEKIHWIRIVSQDELKFDLLINRKDYNKDLMFLKDYLSKHATLIETDEYLQLKEK